MQKKMKKYPFCALMLLCVVIFWIVTPVMGYKVKLDGTLVKREAEKKEENKDKNKEKPEEQTETVPEKPVEEPEEKKAEFVQVGMEYLDGALFIGDSRTSVLYEYAGWDTTHFFVEYGQSIWKVMDQIIDTDAEAGKVTVREALKNQKYDKIYLMLGINELGTGTAETFYEQYKSVVDEIQSMQPDAVIYVQSILHVTDEKDSEGSYINNAEINARNEKIKTLADNEKIFWLDENEVFDAPGTGKLNPEYTSDGVHLKAKYISVWQEYLLSHGIKVEQ